MRSLDSGCSRLWARSRSRPISHKIHYQPVGRVGTSSCIRTVGGSMCTSGSFSHSRPRLYLNLWVMRFERGIIKLRLQLGNTRLRYDLILFLYYFVYFKFILNLFYLITFYEFLFLNVPDFYCWITAAGD